MPETRWDVEDDVVALFGKESFSFQLYIFFESNNQSFLEADHLDQVLLSSSAFFLGIEGFLEAMPASQWIKSCSIELMIKSYSIAFDLIDEALLHIFDRSCTYYPKALSSMCQVRPVPTGIDVFKDVRVYICTYFSLRPVSDASLDGAVAHDLSKDKGWMSLQHDSESVALELEHMIFNELLDEVIG
ncbi:hypothetical protein Droror1_Dr00002857 [Drosera rotundifolia]